MSGKPLTDARALASLGRLWHARAMKYAVFFLALAAPVHAETPLSGDAFEALVTGKTLTFSVGGDPYGVEYYAPGRRVIWSFVNGDCQSGAWYEKPTDAGPQICFVYENNEEEQCWQVFEEAGSIRAEFMNVPGTTVLYQAIEAEPLVCGGVGA